KFQTVKDAGDNNYVGIMHDHTLGDLDITLYDVNGNELDHSTTANDFERISLAGRAKGTYYLRVYGYRGATNPHYQLLINAPGNRLQPDWAEPNNTRGTAYDLNTVEGPHLWTGLSIYASGKDEWFKFHTTLRGVEGQSVGILF